MTKPHATPENWASIGLRIHDWFMKDMGIERHSREEAIFLALALCGEAGELANYVKKLWRDGHKQTYEQNLNLRNEIGKELADVRGYLEHLADALEVDLDEVTAKKTNELIDRWPHIFEDESVRTRSYRELVPEAGSAPHTDAHNPRNTQSDHPSQRSDK